jgi:hypothetical protein
VRSKLLALMVLAGASAFGQVSIGIMIGQPPPPPRVVEVLPPSPAPEFCWVEGYWFPVGNHYKWHAGYWTRPVYPGAEWVAPRYESGRYFQGYWAGHAGRREHDHHWDHDRYRVFREHEHEREHDHGHGHGHGHDRD